MREDIFTHIKSNRVVILLPYTCLQGPLRSKNEEYIYKNSNFAPKRGEILGKKKKEKRIFPFLRCSEKLMYSTSTIYFFKHNGANNILYKSIKAFSTTIWHQSGFTKLFDMFTMTADC